MTVVALDFGGTKISGGLVDNRGKVRYRERCATEASRGKRQVLANIECVIGKVLSSSGKKVTGVGISMPGFIDANGVVVFGGGTLGFLKGVPLRKRLEKKFGVPVVIENDANCFALAESRFGAARGFSDVLGVIWGTGVGGGIVRNGSVFGGAFGGAGEFGHMPLYDEKSKKYSTLEELSSGKNIVLRYKKLGGVLRKSKDLGVGDIYTSSLRGDDIGQTVIADAIRALGIGLSVLANTLNPSIIVLGGGVSNLPAPVYKELRLVVKQFALPSHTKSLKIVRYGLSDDAGLLGAAALVFGK